MAVQMAPFGLCIGTACVVTSAPVWATGGAVLLIGLGVYRWLAGDGNEQKQRTELEDVQGKERALAELSRQESERIRAAYQKDRDQFIQKLLQMIEA